MNADYVKSVFHFLLGREPSQAEIDIAAAIPDHHIVGRLEYVVALDECEESSSVIIRQWHLVFHDREPSPDVLAELVLRRANTNSDEDILAGFVASFFPHSDGEIGYLNFVASSFLDRHLSDVEVQAFTDILHARGPLAVASDLLNSVEYRTGYVMALFLALYRRPAFSIEVDRIVASGWGMRRLRQWFLAGPECFSKSIT